MHIAIKLLALAATLTSTVSAHGFLYGPGSLSSGQEGTVRDIGKINYEIDSLRNPNSGGNFCRGAGKGAVTPISLSSGQDFTVTLALSNGAQHVGDCWVEIVDANDTSKKVQIAGPVQCALPPVAQGDTNKGSGADQQCGGKLPKNLVTNDMCLNTWTFKPQNVDQIKCKDCILRWTWHATHISTSNPEKYENCADVTVSIGGSSGSGDSGGDDKEQEKPSDDQSEPTSTIVKAVPHIPTAAPSTPSTKPSTPRRYRVIKKIIRHKKSSSGSGGSTHVKVDTSDTKASTPSTPATDNSNDGSSGSGSRCSERQMFCGSDPTTFEQCLPDGKTYVHSCAPGTVCKETAASIICDYK